MKRLSIVLLSYLLFALPATAINPPKNPIEELEAREVPVTGLTDEEVQQLVSVYDELSQLGEEWQRINVLQQQVNDMLGTSVQLNDFDSLSFEPQPFLVEIYLNEADRGEQILLLHSNFPPNEGGYLDQVNGWYIYQAEESTLLAGPNGPADTHSDHLADLRLIFAPTDRPEPVVNLHLESVPAGAWSFFEFLNPRRSASQIIPIQITEQSINIPAANEPEVLRHSTRIRQATNGLPARVAIQLRLAKESRQIQNAANTSPSRMNEPKLDFFRTPKNWLEVTVVNEAEDMKAGARGFIIDCARHWPGYLEDATNPSINQARYNAHFNPDFQHDLSNYHHCDLHPVTLVHSNQQQWQSLIGDGEITLVIRQLQPSTTPNDTGEAYTTSPPVIGARFIKIALKNGKPTIVGGNYQTYVKRIILKYAKDFSPASVTLIMYSQKEIDQQASVGYEPSTEMITINAQPELSEDMTDGASVSNGQQEVPLWLMGFGIQSGGAGLMEVPVEVTSPVGAGWLF